MRAILAMLALGLLVAGTAWAAEWRVGPQGGATLTGLSGDSPSGVRLGRTAGFAAGLVAEVRVAEDLWVGLQPQFVRGGASSQISVQSQSEPVDGPGLTLDYLVIPVLARIVADNGRAFVTGGLNPAFLLGADLDDDGEVLDVSSSLSGFAVGAEFGFGVQLPIGDPVLTLEVRYEQGILNLAASDLEVGDGVLPVRFRNSGFQFLVGFLWSPGGE